MTEHTAGHACGLNSRVVLGLAIALIGAAMLVERNDWAAIDHGGTWWIFLLAFFGAAKMIAPGERDGRRRSRRGGFLVLSVSVWALISKMELFGLDPSVSWPLLVIVVGINVVWAALENPPNRRLEEN